MKKDKKIILQSIRNTLQQIAPAGNRLLPQTKIPCDVKRSRGYDRDRPLESGGTTIVLCFILHGFGPITEKQHSSPKPQWRSQSVS